MYKPKKCKECSTEFTPQYPAELICSECKPVAKERSLAKARVKAYQKWCAKQQKAGREWAIGVGKGGSNKTGKDSPFYRTGIGLFHKLKHELRESRGNTCERCSKDLSNSSMYEWVVHHKDHDRTHNELGNLELLCKRCHQIEHECWKAFEGATTSRKT